MRKLLYIIDTTNEWLGRIAGWLLIPLALIVVYDVILRYVFNSPTRWAWDVNIQIMAVIIVLAGGYALLHKGHVAIDILVTGLSTRRRAILDAVMDTFLVGGVALLLWRVSIGAWTSVSITEHYNSTWGPPIYPLKIVMTIGIGAMLLQGIAGWIRRILTAIHGEGAV